MPPAAVVSISASPRALIVLFIIIPRAWRMSAPLAASYRKP
jgi:hypothetical protein